MQIAAIKLPENYLGLGMERTTMERLGSMVVLAGPNGGGKSRILRSVHHAVTHYPLPVQQEQIRRQVAVRQTHLSELRLRLSLTAGEAAVASLKSEINENERTLQIYKDSLADAALVAFKQLRTDKPIHHYVPRPVDFVDPFEQARHEALNAANQVHAGIGFGSLRDGCLAYIGRVQDRWFQATHPHVTITEEEKALAVAEYERLRDDLRKLLGGQLDRNLDGAPTLWGRSIPNAGLSDGQRLLLQLAVALHAQGTKLSEAVLLLDEPETHLHPAAVIDVLETLRKATPNGQLWIATHSLPVLAWAPTESLWFVREGHTKWAGREPELVLSGLLGDAQGRERLESFIQLPAQLASKRFAADCLLAPTVVMTGGDDLQLRQIRDAILKLRNPSRPLRILDFGAGKGRLLAALREAHDEARPFAEVIDYRAFDAGSTDSEHCSSLIDTAYGEGASAERYFSQYAELEAQLDPGSVDVAILCNVLHEVPPGQWPSLLGPDSALARRLRPDGFLLIVEDIHIPVGEKAHRYGFLLLDTSPLKGLFAWRETDASIQFAAEREGRLKAWLVPASLLQRVSAATRTEALRRLQRQAREELHKLREAASSYRNGQLHGLWTQLFANASLALEEFGPTV
ncbi:methyltransferase domain-containing protein [Corallococcus exercitus]|uniref:AAA family ATPase n=1 Tax=Corallococcus exercitus TaxID=2316736 RepID=UPI000EA252B6|nr:AAA family ATPase [Corallococcus exercitus]RKG69472.1 methyltransferase domain-containing protein [Corallococcus exercitus]